MASMINFGHPYGIHELLSVCQISLHIIDPSSEELFHTRTLSLKAPYWSVTIGRGSHNNDGLLLPSPINGWYSSKVMSRVHSVVSVDPVSRVVSVRDANSMHGTFLASHKLSSTFSSPLHQGQTVTFGTEVVRDVVVFHPLTVKVSWDWKTLAEHDADSMTKSSPIFNNTFTADYSSDGPEDPEDEAVADDHNLDVEVVKKTTLREPSVEFVGIRPRNASSSSMHSVHTSRGNLTPSSISSREEVVEIIDDNPTTSKTQTPPSNHEPIASDASPEEEATTGQEKIFEEDSSPESSDYDSDLDDPDDLSSAYCEEEGEEDDDDKDPQHEDNANHTSNSKLITTEYPRLPPKPVEYQNMNDPTSETSHWPQQTKPDGNQLDTYAAPSTIGFAGINPDWCHSSPTYYSPYYGNYTYGPSLYDPPAAAQDPTYQYPGRLPSIPTCAYNSAPPLRTNQPYRTQVIPENTGEKRKASCLDEDLTGSPAVSGIVDSATDLNKQASSRYATHCIERNKESQYNEVADPKQEVCLNNSTAVPTPIEVSQTRQLSDLPIRKKARLQGKPSVFGSVLKYTGTALAGAVVGAVGLAYGLANLDDSVFL